jgi:hypothetical protein
MMPLKIFIAVFAESGHEEPERLTHAVVLPESGFAFPSVGSEVIAGAGIMSLDLLGEICDGLESNGVLSGGIALPCLGPLMPSNGAPVSTFNGMGEVDFAEEFVVPTECVDVLLVNSPELE